MQQQQEQQKLRVPLSVLIDYKGFRCLAVGQIPIMASSGPMLGFYQGNYVSDQELKNTFMKVGQLLHLKENKNAVENQKLVVNNQQVQ